MRLIVNRVVLWTEAAVVNPKLELVAADAVGNVVSNVDLLLQVVSEVARVVPKTKRNDIAEKFRI